MDHCLQEIAFLDKNMNFGLALNVSVEIKNKSMLIQSLSNELEEYFKTKQYGADIKTFTIGVVCISPQFEPFFKEKKPKYIKGIKVINPDGIPFTLEDDFEYDVKIDFESFKNANEEEARKILAGKILLSLIVFEKIKSKIKDFDMNSFKADLEEYFKNHNLIS